MAPQLISYQDAKAKGLKRYFTGKPCKRGHITQRNVASCACVECVAAVTRKWANTASGREIKLRQTREWFERNTGYPAEWAANNPDAISDAKSRWHYKNQERQIKRALAWAKANPEKARAACRNRTALRKNANGSHTADEVLALLERQNWICATPGCGTSLREKRHIDHIVALKNGGSNDISNLQGLCPPCNCSKSTKDMDEWLAARARRAERAKRKR